MLLAGQMPRIKFKHLFEKKAMRKLYMADCGSAIGSVMDGQGYGYGVETAHAKA
jgi:hypothetical protein